MRILFTAQPAYGHLHPLLPLADAARSAGHDVAIGTSALFGPVVEATGFRAIAVGLNWLEADKSTLAPELRPAPESTLEEYFAQQFVRAPAGLMAKDIVELARTWRPDVIVRDRTEFGGAIAANATGVPSASIQVGNPSLITPAVLAASEAPYNDARRRLDLAADPGLVELAEEPVLMFAPRELADPHVPLPSQLATFRPTALDRGGDASIPDWARGLGSQRPLVYATLGTIFNNPKYELPLFPALIAGLGGEPFDVVLTIGPNVDPEMFGPVPDNVNVAPFIPQSLLFPQVSVVVCHGGFGTVLAAVEHGLPLIVVPFGADQHLNAAAVTRLGIGLTLDEEEVGPGELLRAVRTVLDDPRYRRNARRLQDRASRLPSVHDAVELVEAMVDPGDDHSVASAETGRHGPSSS